MTSRPLGLRAMDEEISMTGAMWMLTITTIVLTGLMVRDVVADLTDR